MSSATVGAGKSGAKIGIMLLETTPDRLRGSLAHPDTFECDVKQDTLEGIWVDQILSASPAHAPSFLQAAKRLERDGADVLVTNCGYSIVYQAAVQQSVGIPAALSSLMLLPLLNALRSPSRKIGLLTYDAIKLTEAHLRAAWPEYDARAVAIGGLQGTRSWSDMARNDAVYDVDQITADITIVVQRLMKEDLQFLLVECAALCAFIPHLRSITGIPVFDIVSLATFLSSGLQKK
jgi:Asp/Glu/hydantoin racemase